MLQVCVGGVSRAEEGLHTGWMMIMMKMIMIGAMMMLTK